MLKILVGLHFIMSFSKKESYTLWLQPLKDIFPAQRQNMLDPRFKDMTMFDYMKFLADENNMTRAGYEQTMIALEACQAKLVQMSGEYQHACHMIEELKQRVQKLETDKWLQKTTVNQPWGYTK